MGALPRKMLMKKCSSTSSLRVKQPPPPAKELNSEQGCSHKFFERRFSNFLYKKF